MASNSAGAALARELADLKRRLAALERTGQLSNSSVLDGDGNTVEVLPALLAGEVAALAAAEALEAALSAQATADGKAVVFYGSAAPLDPPDVGDLWMQTPANVLHRWSEAGAWEDVQDQGVTDALVAANDAQATADGKIVTFWQGAEPTTGTFGDLWYNTGAGNAVSRHNGTAWILLPAGTGALAQGAINPDRLSVGVVDNLIQDPGFLTGTRTLPSRWTLGTAPANDPGYRPVVFTGATGFGAGSFTIATTIPVEAGQTIRAAVELKRNAFTTTGLAGMRLTFLSSTGAMVSQSVAGLDLAPAADAPSAGQWYVAEWRAVAPAGAVRISLELYASGSSAGGVNTTGGEVQFIRPVCQAVSNRVQSDSYVHGESGWAFDDTAAQVPTLNVLAELGADRVTTDSVMLAGVDLAGYVEAAAKGITAFGVLPSASGLGLHTANTSGTTELVCLELAGGRMVQGRAYRITVTGHLGGSVPNDAFELKIRYTTDGTTPVVTSGILDGTLTRVTAPNGGTQFNMSVVYFPGGTYQNVRMVLCLVRVIGTGTGYLHLTDVNRRLEWAVEDLGLRVPLAIAQKSKTSGTADPAPTAQYSGSWPATWGRSYAANGAMLADDPPDLWHGQLTAAQGITRSLFGFDYAAIQTALAGALINSVKLTYRVRRTENTTGSAITLASHAYTAKPATWAAGSVNATRGSFAGQKEGVTYTQTLALAIGNEFKAGTTRGLGFGPPTDRTTALTYAVIYGTPILTITYEK